MEFKKFFLFQIVAVIIFSSFAFAVGITYEYDSRNQLRKATYSDGTVVAYAYDNIGNRVSVAVTVPDLDGDGLSDTWEKRFFGNMARDGSGDFDGDGINDLSEYRNGTNPAADNRLAGGGGASAMSQGVPQSAPFRQASVTIESAAGGDVAGTSGKLPASPATGTTTGGDGSDGGSDEAKDPGMEAGDVRVVVAGETGDPFEGVAIRAFADESGDTGIVAETGRDGAARFRLERFAGEDVRFRADYLTVQFWSDWIRLPMDRATEVIIPEAPVEIAALGDDVIGAKIYLCDEAGKDLNRSAEIDAAGVVTFDLPVGGKFRFRIEGSGGQCWSDVLTVKAGETNRLEISSDCGVFTVAQIPRAKALGKASSLR